MGVLDSEIERVKMLGREAGLDVESTRFAGFCSLMGQTHTSRTTKNPPALANLLLGVLFAASVTACGGDDSPTGPTTGPRGVEFPTINPGVAEAWCVRGTLPAPGRTSGSIGPTDCPSAVTGDVLSVPVGAGPDSYFETWRLRVAEGAILTVSVSSGFDSFLDVYRVPDLSNPSSAVYVDSDDDSSGRGLFSLDAEVEVTVVPGVEYWVMVSGFDATESGPYSVIVEPVL